MRSDNPAGNSLLDLTQTEINMKTNYIFVYVAKKPHSREVVAGRIDVFIEKITIESIKAIEDRCCEKLNLTECTLLNLIPFAA